MKDVFLSDVYEPRAFQFTTRRGRQFLTQGQDDRTIDILLNRGLEMFGRDLLMSEPAGDTEIFAGRFDEVGGGK